MTISKTKYITCNSRMTNCEKENVFLPRPVPPRVLLLKLGLLSFLVLKCYFYFKSSCEESVSCRITYLQELVLGVSNHCQRLDFSQVLLPAPFHRYRNRVKKLTWWVWTEIVFFPLYPIPSKKQDRGDRTSEQLMWKRGRDGNLRNRFQGLQQFF